MFNSIAISTELKMEIENLYRVFSIVEKPGGISYCTHCHDQHDFKALLSKPLREISSTDFDHYIWSAFNTAGDMETYKYFVPRLLELLITDAQSNLDCWIIFKNIHRANFDEWSDEQKNAIH